MPRLDKIDECPRRKCDGRMKELRRVFLISRNDPLFYDVLFQCDDCLSITQAVYSKDDDMIRHGTMVSAIQFLHKVNGKWVS